MKKLFTLMLAVFAMVAQATEYDMDLGSLSGDTYNQTTHEFTFGTSWAENQWWIGDSSPLDISSYGEFVVEYTGATSASKFRVYLEPVSGTTQTVYPTANTSFGRSVFKLASGLNNIKKIVISDAGTAFNMTLTRAYFRSKSNESSTSLWTDTQALGNWYDITDLTKDGDGKTALKSAKVGDVIKVTFTNAVSDNQINVRNSGYNDFIDGTFSGFTEQDAAQTAEYVIPNAEVLESIQLNGIMVSGKHATVTNIDLLTYSESYDACMVTIGSDEIATFSTGYKKLDFTSTGITPYYASSYSSGTVNLTAVSDKTTWGYQGYILKGNAGTYEVPTTETATYQKVDHLKATGDYQAELKASQSGDSNYRYIFAKKNGDSETIGFYKLTKDHTLAAHKAYLETTDDITPTLSPTRGITLDFGDGTTAILKVIDDGDARQIENNDGKYYTLQGTSVQTPTKKGLYIVNGKKVLVK